MTGDPRASVRVSTSWWTSPEWLAYEAAYGDEPGARARLLASATWRTRIIDLAQDEAVLWRGIRKSYRALIHAAERRGTILPISGPVTKRAASICRGLHGEASGRTTRSDETWSLMGTWLETGHGLAVLALYRSGRYVDFAYFSVSLSDGWAYYFSAASLEKNIHHAVIWRGMLALKRLGVRWLEMGWQGEALDEKGRGVEYFKTGFGGMDMAVRETLA